MIEKLKPYADLIRLDKPIGVWLLLLPGLWAIILAGGGIFSLSTQQWLIIFYFFLGAFIMRSAGCIINDLWDCKIDAQVERTKARPLASGSLKLFHALIFLALLLSMGLAILLQLSLVTVLLGFLVIPLIILYPLMKRMTWWPQAFLGLTFNFSALMGWSAITGILEPAALFLYAAGIFWTLGYDTIYGHQDKDDDAMIGVKSTSIKFGQSSKIWVSVFFILTLKMIAMALLVATSSRLSFILLALPGLHFIWQVKTWEMNNPVSCLQIFKSNQVTGVLILIALALSG